MASLWPPRRHALGDHAAPHATVRRDTHRLQPKREPVPHQRLSPKHLLQNGETLMEQMRTMATNQSDLNRIQPKPYFMSSGHAIELALLFAIISNIETRPIGA
jgi:hypothetical protein